MSKFYPDEKMIADIEARMHDLQMRIDRNNHLATCGRYKGEQDELIDLKIQTDEFKEENDLLFQIIDFYQREGYY